MRKVNKNVAIIIASILGGSELASISFAQTAPNAGVQLEQQKQLNPTLKPSVNIPSLDEPEKKKSQKLKSDTPVKINGFTITGTLTVYSETDLQKMLQKYIGQTFPVSKLFEITDELTTSYRDKGYFLAKAYLPAQDVTIGIIQIRIEEGRRDSSKNGIKIIGDDFRIGKDRIRNIIDNAIPTDKAIEQEELERAILLMRDLPGVGASANLEKGSEVGTTRIVADISEGPIFNPWLGVDNSGGRLTGEWRATAGMDINDPFGDGEHVSLYAAQSMGSGDMKFFRAAIDRPIGYTGLKIGTALNYLEYKVGKELSSTDSQGRALNLSFDARYPIYRTRKTSLFAEGLYDLKNMSDSAAGVTTNKKAVKVLRAGLSLSHTDKFLQGGHTTANFKIHAGKLNLELGSIATSDSSSTGAFTDGSFKKYTFGLRRVQRNFNNFFLIGDVKGQLAGKNLDSSEKFQLGGVNGVRAYPSGEALGDNAIKASLEAHYVFADVSDFGDLRLIGFYDWGRIHQYHEEDGGISLDTPNNYDLAGYGLGVTIGRPSDLDLNLFWAHRTGDNPGAPSTTGLDNDGSKDINRFWLSLTAHF